MSQVAHREDSANHKVFAPMQEEMMQPVLQESPKQVLQVLQSELFLALVE
jgi:hypothetical protein